MKSLSFTDTKSEKNANIPDVCLKYKFAVLIMKIKCKLDINLNKNADVYEEKYLAKNQEFIMLIRLYLEKGYFILASNIDDKFVDFLVHRENYDDAIKAASFYLESIKYGHSKYHHSMTRALSLYFAINRINPSLLLSQKIMILAEELPLFI